MTTLQNNDVSKDEITTSYISIYPKYDYSTGTGVIVGYTVYVSLTITIKGIYNDNSKVAAVIDGIASAGVSSISGITYDSSDPSYGKDNARKAAFADATNKAKQYAKLAGRKLGKIVIIDETNQYYYPYYTKVGSDIGPNGQLAAPLIGQDSDTTLPVGKITVIVNVIITWIII